MKLRTILLFIPCLTLLLSADTAKDMPEDPQPEKKYQIKTIVLDAGHGGHDPGCLGGHSQEKHVALNIVLKLGKYIEENFPAVNVIYTRKIDVFVELDERAKIANDNEADLFISIHCNAAGSPRAYGTETYVMGPHRNDANLKVAKRENSVILLEEDYKQKYDYDPNSPAAHILFSVYQSAYIHQSIFLAQKVEDEFKNRVKRHSRGVKQAGFLVLYKTTMPSILVESGFLTNKNDETFLLSDRGQDLMASGLYRAFRDYKNEMERKSIEEILQEKPIVEEQKVTEEMEEGMASGENNRPEPEETTTEESDNDTTAGIQASEDNLKQEESTVTGSNIEFRVQFIAVSKAIDLTKPPYNRIGDVYSEKMPNGVIRYFSGQYTHPDEAKKALNSLQNHGFKDAFLVAYREGQRLDIDVAFAEFK